MRSSRAHITITTLVCLACSMCSCSTTTEAPPDGGTTTRDASGPDAGPPRTRMPRGRLSARGTEIVDADGTPVALRGVNLGAWIFVETWMDQVDYAPHGRLVAEADRLEPSIASAVRDAVREAGRLDGDVDASRAAYFDRVGAALPSGTDMAAFTRVRDAALACPDVADDSDAPLRAALETRFGVEGRDRVLDALADAWITEDDVREIAARGANLVRIPTGYRAWLGGSDSAEITLPLTLRERTVQRVTQLLDWCDAHGVRAVLDLQESIGGHNDYSGPARLYTDSAAQEATIALWVALSDLYRERDTIAAYSLLAEPYSAPDVATMVAMYDRLHDAIRDNDDDHLLIVHDGFFGMEMLPSPSEQGWEGVVYSTHLFEWGAPTLLAHQAVVLSYADTWERSQARHGNPYFVGSFSTFRDEPFAYDAFDFYARTFADHGWSWSMWAWKRVDDPLDQELFGERTSWGVMRDFARAEDAQRLDVCHDDLDTLVSRAAALRTSALTPNPELDARFRAAVRMEP